MSLPSTPTPTPIDPAPLAAIYIGPTSHDTSAVLPQLALRSTILQAWSIPPGSRVLEIGCGQGDCTLALAAAVGPAGHVDALDPAPPTYGGPVTIGASQANLKASALGARMTFHEADPVDYLRRYEGPPYDFVVCFQSLWYFSSEERIRALLSSFKGGRFARTLLIAEWALGASSAAAWPHVLAALSIANLETRMEEDGSNICSAVSPAWFRRFLAGEGMRITREGVVVPPEGLKEGMWETVQVLQGEYAERIARRWEGEPRARLAAEGLRDAVCCAAERVGVRGVGKGEGREMLGSMDVWWVVVDLDG